MSLLYSPHFHTHLSFSVITKVLNSLVKLCTRRNWNRETMGHAFSILQTQLFTWQQSCPNSVLQPSYAPPENTMGHDRPSKEGPQVWPRLDLPLHEVLKQPLSTAASPRGPAFLPSEHGPNRVVSPCGSHVNPGRSWELACTSGSAEQFATDLF